MLRSLLGADPPGPPVRVLAIGAHPDDLEIGCGGTLRRLAAEAEIAVRYVILAADGPRGEEARSSARAWLGDALESVDLHAFRDGHLPSRLTDLKETFEAIRSGFEPSLILTHRLDDRHQDHRILSEVTWQTFREHLILEYEIPKYEGDTGQVNVLVGLSREIGQQKVDHLMRAFPSQRDRRWFTPETFWSLLRLRGLETGGRADYAEGFASRKLVL